MDPEAEEEEVQVLTPPTQEEGEEREEEQQENEEEEENEEEDARIFNTWMQRCRGGTQQEKAGEEEEEEEEGKEGEAESDGGRTDSRSSLEPSVGTRVARRASLPCPATLSAMQLSRLHSSTQAPVTARVLLRRTSSRRLLASQQEGPAPERRSSLITTIPEAIAPERRGQFRRRNVMSLSDADSVCLICHNDLHGGSGGTRELQCTHTFHRECIEERLWRRQSCPTCHVHVHVPQPVYWSPTRVKVP